jgi:uncharacterized sulfatase
MPRPNILIVCTDQQRTDTLSAYGSTFTSTPGFDHVARRGTRFSRTYCPSAVCTPSRVSLMTGQYTMRHGAWNVGVNAGDDLTFLSHRLGRAGYDTCLIGKAHFEAFLPGADQSRESSRDYAGGYGNWTGPYYGFEHVELALGHAIWGMAGHYGGWLREQASEAELARYRQARQVDEGPEFGGNAYDWDLPTRLHNSVWTTDRALDYLARRKPGADPFLLMVSYEDPHHPHAVPVDYPGRLDPADMPLPAFVPGELDDKPPHFLAAHEGRLAGSPFARRWPVSGQHTGFDYRNVTPEAQRLGRAYYHSMVRLMDDQLVRLWAGLAELGLENDTLVIVTSDHGELLGDHGLWMKGPFHYEPLVNVPFLMMGPGVPEGRIDARVTSLVDVAPTCLAAAGIAADRTEFDGENLFGALPPDRTVLCETILDWQGLICRSVIGERYKLTTYANESFGELFDRKADPGELRNLWTAPEAATARELLLRAQIDHDVRMHASSKERIAYA